jgi:disulfide bond formation protein DsbB
MIEAVVRRFPWLLLVASIGSLLSALGFQHIGGFEPCILCLYQRWPYVAVAALAAIALALPRPRWVRPALVGLCALALFVGGGVAVFHVGVEQHWWAGTAACEGQVSIGRGSIEDLRAQMLGAPVARCDQVPWSLFGISMAGYNAMISFGLGALSLFAAWRLARERSA